MAGLVFHAVLRRGIIAVLRKYISARVPKVETLYIPRQYLLHCVLAGSGVCVFVRGDTARR